MDPATTALVNALTSDIANLTAIVQTVLPLLKPVTPPDNSTLDATLTDLDTHVQAVTKELTDAVAAFVPPTPTPTPAPAA